MTKQDKKSLTYFASYHVSDSYNQDMVNESFNFYPLYESFSSDIDVFTKMLTSRTVYVGDIKKYVLWLFTIDAINKNTARFIERILEDYASYKLGYIDEEGDVRNMDNVKVDITEIINDNSDVYRIYVKNRGVYGQWTWGHIRSVILSGIIRSSGVLEDAENKGILGRLSSKVISIIKGVGRFVKYGLKHIKMKLGMEDEKYFMDPISIRSDGMGSYYDMDAVKAFLIQRNVDVKSRLFTLIGLCRYPNTLNPIIKLKAKDRLTDLMYKSFKTDMVIAIHKFNPSRRMDDDLYRSMLVTLYYNLSAEFNEKDVKRYIQEVADIVESVVMGDTSDSSRFVDWVYRDDMKHGKDPLINVRNSRVNESKDDETKKSRNSRTNKVRDNPSLFWMKYTDNSYVDIPMAKWKDGRYDMSPNDDIENDDGNMYADDDPYTRRYMVDKMNSKGRYKPYDGVDKDIQENARTIINHRAQSAGVAAFRRQIREMTRLMVTAGIASEFIDSNLFKTAMKSFIMFHGSKLTGYLPSAKTTSSGRDLYNLVIDGMSIKDYIEETNSLFDGIIRYNTVTHDTVSGESRVVENLALKINKDRASYIYLGALGEYLKLKYNHDIVGDTLIILSKLIKEYNRIIIKPADMLADALKTLVHGGGASGIRKLNNAFRKAFRWLGISSKPKDISEAMVDDLIGLADEDLSVDDFITQLKAVKHECFYSKPLTDKGAEQVAISSMVESSLMFPQPDEFDTLVESVSTSKTAYNMAKSFGVQSIKNYLVDKYNMEYMVESTDDDYIKKYVDFVCNKVDKSNLGKEKKLGIGYTMWSIDYAKYTDKNDDVEDLIKYAKLRFNVGRRRIPYVEEGLKINVFVIDSRTAKDSGGHYVIGEMVGDSTHRKVKVYVTDAITTHMRSFKYVNEASRNIHQPIKCIIKSVADDVVIAEFDALRDAGMDLTSSESRQEAYRKKGIKGRTDRVRSGNTKKLDMNKVYTPEQAYDILYKEFEFRHRPYKSKKYTITANKLFYGDASEFVRKNKIDMNYPPDPFIDMVVNCGKINSDQVTFLMQLTFRKRFNTRGLWCTDKLSSSAKLKINTLASKSLLMLHQLKGDLSRMHEYGFSYITQSSTKNRRGKTHPTARTLEFICNLLKVSETVDPGGISMNLPDIFKTYVDKPVKKLLTDGFDDSTADMIGHIIDTFMAAVSSHDQLYVDRFKKNVMVQMNHLNYILPHALNVANAKYTYRAKGRQGLSDDVKYMLKPKMVKENYSTEMTGVYRDEENNLTYMASTTDITGRHGKPQRLVAEGNHMGVTDTYTVIYADGDNWVVMK